MIDSCPFVSTSPPAKHTAANSNPNILFLFIGFIFIKSLILPAGVEMTNFVKHAAQFHRLFKHGLHILAQAEVAGVYHHLHPLGVVLVLATTNSMESPKKSALMGLVAVILFVKICQPFCDA